MRGLRIRDAVSDDVKSTANLHVESWKIAYAPILKKRHLDWVSVQREIRRKRKLIKAEEPFLIAEKAGELLGFLTYSPCDDTEIGGGFDIDSFWVHHERTRQGVGGALLRALRRRETPARLCAWVLTGVSAGPNFYEKHGFVPQEDTRTDFVFLGERMPMVRYVKKIRKRRQAKT